jgi:oligosaccharide repeat unit polymerase
MLYVVIVILCLLLAANYAFSRNLLYPPCVYTAVWLISLIGLAASGDAFFPVEAQALIIYLVGAVAFSGGGLIVLCSRLDARVVWYSGFRRDRIYSVLDMALLFVVAGLPLYMHNALTAVGQLDASLLAELRRMELEAEISSGGQFSLLRNLVVLSQFVAMALHYENDGRRARKWRSYVAVIVAIVYAVFTGSKGAVITLIITLTFISAIRARRLNFRSFVWAALLVLGFFGAGLLLINYVSADTVVSLQTLRLLAETLRTYWLGGLVAFNDVVQAPESLLSTQHINRFFLETWNSLGGEIELPSINAEYTSIAPDNETNTYTIYFSYFKDHGWMGTILGTTAIGVIGTWLYRQARLGGAEWAAFYAVTMTGAVLSFHAEHFLLALNFYIKMLVFFYLTYHLFPRLSFWKPAVPEYREYGA